MKNKHQLRGWPRVCTQVEQAEQEVKALQSRIKENCSRTWSLHEMTNPRIYAFGQRWQTSHLRMIVSYDNHELTTNLACEIKNVQGKGLFPGTSTVYAQLSDFKLSELPILTPKVQWVNDFLAGEIDELPPSDFVPGDDPHPEIPRVKGNFPL